MADLISSMLEGGAAGGSVGGPVGAIAGSLIQGLFSWYGAEKQGQAAGEAEATNLAIYQEEEHKKAEETAKEWKWKSDEEGYQRTKTVAGRLLSFLNGTPELQANLKNRLAAKPAAYDFRGLNPLR